MEKDYGVFKKEDLLLLKNLIDERLVSIEEENYLDYNNMLSNKDYIYIIENFFRVLDRDKGYIPFILTPRQREVVDFLMNRNSTIVVKPRIAGISTTVAAVMACVCAFATSKSPEKVVILGHNIDMSKRMLSMIKDFLSQLPRCIWGGAYVNNPHLNIFSVENKNEFILMNGSGVKAMIQSKDSIRGYSPTFLIAEEPAFWKNGIETLIPAMSSLVCTNRTAVLISTPNGENFFHDICTDAKAGKNDFKVVEMHWYEDPRFNKDLKWIKENEEILETEFTFKSYEEKVRKGYSPISSWYLTMCSNFNGIENLIAQELDAKFVV